MEFRIDANLFDEDAFSYPVPPGSNVTPPSPPATKTKNRRKMQKASRKKNRKKR